MNKRFSLISVILLFAMPVINSPSTVNANLDSSTIRVSDSFGLNATLVGVSEGDSFTYVLGRHNIPETGNFEVYRNSSSGEKLEIQEQSEYTITITNSTPIKSGDYYTFTHRMSVEFSNSTFSMLGEIRFDPLSYIVFTDWNYTYDQTHKFFQTLKNSADIRSFEIIDGDDEFTWKVDRWDIVTNFEGRFDKVTGMLLYTSLEAEEDNEKIFFEYYQKGYQVPIDETTSSDTDPNTDDFTLPGGLNLTHPGGDDITDTKDTSDTNDSIGIAGFRSITSIIALFVTITFLRRRK